MRFQTKYKISVKAKNVYFQVHRLTIHLENQQTDHHKASKNNRFLLVPL